MSRICAVAGNPIFHSKSPDIFNAAFGELSLNAVYTRLAAAGAEEVIATAREIGIDGLNITSPFKTDIIQYLDEVEADAKKIGSVNTIVRSGRRFIGYNTDVEGVLEALRMNAVQPAGKRAVVLGAGGAAKSTAVALISAGADVVIVNRTFEKAQSIAEASACRASRIEDIEREVENADILVSCLSTGKHVVPSHSLKKGLIILDANYGEETALVQEGRAKGCTIIDGREWLLFQGTKAFTHFTGMEPPVTIMRKALYEKRSFKKRNIALIGFMGVGKSTVGRYVAKRLNMSLIDIDSEIERKIGSSIGEIFEQSGEETFRKMEANEIEGIAAMSKKVISCGGGAVLNKGNMDHLREHSIVVWLWAAADTILQRIGDNGTRPLLNVRDKRSEVEKLLRFRKPFYAYASDLLIRTDKRKPREIAERIYDESSKFLKS